MRATHRDSDPDWRAVCEAVFPGDTKETGTLFEEMAVFADRLAQAPSLVAEFGIPDQVKEMAMARCADFVKPFQHKPTNSIHSGG